MKEVKDFINPGETNNSGNNFPLDDYNSPLRLMTDSQTGITNEYDVVYCSDTDKSSIPDCIGRLTRFAELLNEGDTATVAEWRGMLCSIFFQVLISGRHELVTKYVNIDNNNSALTNIIFDKFLKNSDLTGYKYNDMDLPIPRKFQFYKKDDVLFAMVVPGVVIMPLANYNRNVFSGSNWVRENTGEWDIDTINIYFRGNVSQAAMFLQYLENLREVSGIYAKAPLTDFIMDICANMPQGFVAPTAMVTSDVEVVTVLTEGPLVPPGSIYDGQFFEKKLLCFKPYGDEIENGVGLANFKNAWDNYRIDHEGELLTPIKVYEFCKERDDLPVYVVPPINKKFLDAVTSGDVEFVSWSAKILTTSRDKSAIEVKINIKICGRLLPPITNVYFKQDILVAEDLPYITMWPFVKPAPGTPEWKEYFVGVLNRKNIKSDFERPTFTEIDKKLNESCVDPMKAVDIEDIKVSVYGNADVFNVSTDSFRMGVHDPNGRFNLIKTTEFPEFVMLSKDDEPVGCWQINKGLARNLGSVQGTQGVIGFDFATTSTVEVLNVNGITNFIEGPGAYLYDVFNPFWECREDSEMKVVWKLIQDYYLFGSKAERLDKIYSYGQANRAEKDGVPYNMITNYVTGRAVFVSPDYIQRIADKYNRAVLNNASIYTPIKWPDGPNTSSVRVATENFILNCLTWGLLAARIERCESVKINVSYPSGGDGTIVNNIMAQYLPYLGNISGYENNLTYDSFSAATANAKYLVDGKNYMWHDIAIPNPENGFMLVDIGGGTTDISVCQYSDIQLPFEEKMKCETSFNYAGRELIDISLLKIPDFKDLWAFSGKKGSIGQFELENILMRFSYDGTFDPEHKRFLSFKCVLSFVDFLLDQAVISIAFVGPHIADRVDHIKYKFLALSWVLGRYVRHLHDDGIISIDEHRGFRIFLNGAASKGIRNFCELNDTGFMAKCRDAASYGYYNNKITRDSRPFIEIEVLSGERKQDVAFGLTQLESNSVARGGNNGWVPAFGDLVDFDDDGLDPLDDVKSTRVELRELDCEAAKDYFKKIIQVVNKLETSHPKYEDVMVKHGSTINEFIDNGLIRKRIAELIRDEYIFEELYALYTFEKYLDTLA